ncbi:MAG: T9SS type A sorting domain-containing protein [Saprospiraceae bacterium]|nr:T9SS type A sorting domain-containing protein [Saprospiraceae bacterium]
MPYPLFARPLLLPLLLLLPRPDLAAQSLPLRVVAAAGTTAVVAASGGQVYQFFYTLGEPAIQTAQAGNFRWQEGFWQPDINTATETVELLGLALDIRVLPNPSRDHFSIQLEGPPMPLALRCSLFDLLGRPVETALLPAGETQVQMGQPALPAGFYFLRLQTPDGRLIRSVSLQKTN